MHKARGKHISSPSATILRQYPNVLFPWESVNTKLYTFVFSCLCDIQWVASGKQSSSIPFGRSNYKNQKIFSMSRIILRWIKFFYILKLVFWIIINVLTSAGNTSFVNGTWMSTRWSWYNPATKMQSSKGISGSFSLFFKKTESSKSRSLTFKSLLLFWHTLSMELWTLSAALEWRYDFEYFFLFLPPFPTQIESERVRVVSDSYTSSSFSLVTHSHSLISRSTSGVELIEISILPLLCKDIISNLSAEMKSLLVYVFFVIVIISKKYGNCKLQINQPKPTFDRKLIATILMTFDRVANLIARRPYR